MNTFEKLEKIRDFYGISTKDFQKLLGISPTKYYELKRGNISKLSAEMTYYITQSFPDVNAKWLIFEEGAMVDNTNIRTDNHHNSTGDVSVGAVGAGGNVTIHASQVNGVELMTRIDHMVLGIEKIGEQVRQQNDQITRLLSIIEHMQRND